MKKKIERVLVNCPKCGGQGYTCAYDQYGVPYYPINCETCNKKGKVWVSSNYFNIYEEENKTKSK